MASAANIKVVFHGPTGPPRQCEKCKGARFSLLPWLNRDGTTELTYCCAGCGRVYDPQPIDWADVQRAMLAAIDAAYSNTSRVFTSFSAYMEEAEDVIIKPPRDPHRRENWRAMERKHGRRWKGRG